MERTARFRRLSFRSAPNVRQAIGDHKKLLEAIRSGDADLAQKLSSAHIRLYLSQRLSDQ